MAIMEMNFFQLLRMITQLRASGVTAVDNLKYAQTHSSENCGLKLKNIQRLYTEATDESQEGCQTQVTSQQYSAYSNFGGQNSPQTIAIQKSMMCPIYPPPYPPPLYTLSP